MGLDVAVQGLTLSYTNLDFASITYHALRDTRLKGMFRLVPDELLVPSVHAKAPLAAHATAAVATERNTPCPAAEHTARTKAVAKVHGCTPAECHFVWVSFACAAMPFLGMFPGCSHIHMVISCCTLHSTTVSTFSCSYAEAFPDMFSSNVQTVFLQQRPTHSEVMVAKHNGNLDLIMTAPLLKRHCL